jgi:hypothetical protein
MRRRWLLLLLSFVAAVDLFARVGGGSSYSGGGSSDGGGDGIDLELLYYLVRFLIWLTIEHPMIGIPVDIVVVIALVLWFRRRRMPKRVLKVTTAPRAASPPRIAELRKFDPNFSEITFSDFCYSLYAHAHTARGTGALDRYAPYLSAEARGTLRGIKRGLRDVRGVIVGSFTVSGFGGLETPIVTATVEFESNYTEVAGPTQESFYARERWVLERRRDILSPPPEKAKADHCPRCGAALSTRTDGSCDYCGVRIESGAFQWYVRQVIVQAREARGPLLTSNVPEQGTDLPTVWQPGLAERRRELEASHPGFDWDALSRRVLQIAVDLQEAWTAREWERVRPLETEPLFQMHRYWIDAYTKQNLRNIIDGHRVTRIEVVKVDRDAFYESITVRMWAEGRDYTEDATGRVVSGSKTALRQWSEYWTLIRNRAAHGDGNVSCQNCGAKLAAGTTGVCQYCGGKLTSGEFDWVLSRIEQDESYGG